MFRSIPQCYPVANNVLNVEFLKSIRSNALSALIGAPCDNHRFKHTVAVVNAANGETVVEFTYDPWGNVTRKYSETYTDGATEEIKVSSW